MIRVIFMIEMILFKVKIYLIPKSYESQFRLCIMTSPRKETSISKFKKILVEWDKCDKVRIGVKTWNKFRCCILRLVF